MTKLIQQVMEYVGRMPMVVLRFREDLSESLQKSRKGLDWFSFAERHEHFNDVPCPTLCLLEARGEDGRVHCYLGVTRSRRAVSTADSRLILEEMVKIGVGSICDMVGALIPNQDKHIRRAWEKALQTGKISVLTPELSIYLAELLAKNSENREGINKVFSYLMEKCGATPWAQRNAIDLALSAFGIKHKLEYQDIRKGVRLREDRVIEQDAIKLQGFKAVKSDMTGRFEHRLGNERVVIYVANRNLLEEMVGVDLIYINDAVGNIVMVQYKMLDHDAGEWVFRPNTHFWKQVKKMKILTCLTEKKDYRLNDNPFFFKFVRRKSSEGDLRSFVLSLDHLKQHLKSPKTKGARGGSLLTYKSLHGVYLRHGDMVGLLRSGYIGTHRSETEALTEIFDQVAKGNRDIVVAWKEELSSSDEG